MADSLNQRARRRTMSRIFENSLEDYDRRHLNTMTEVHGHRSFKKCDFLTMEHNNVVLSYNKAVVAIRKRLDDPLYDPPKDASRRFKKLLLHHLKRQEDFLKYLKISRCR